MNIRFTIFFVLLVLVGLSASAKDSPKRTKKFLALPTCDFDVVEVSGCVPFEAFFEDKSSADVLEWKWDFDNDGVIDSEDFLPSFTYTKAGVYTVTLTVSNNDGSATKTKQRLITVYAPPSVVLNDRSACVGDSVVLTASVSNGKAPYNYFWSSPDDVLFESNSSSPKMLLEATSRIVLEIIDANNCSSIDTMLLTANPKPVKPIVNVDGTTMSVNYQGTSYIWFRDGVQISGVTSRTYNVSQQNASSTYNVQVVNEFGCVSEKSDNVVLKSTSVQESDFESIELLPNPLVNQLTIRTQQPLQYTIYNLFGEQIFANNSSSNSVVDFSNVPSGIYVITLRVGNSVQTRKIVKE